MDAMNSYLVEWCCRLYANVCTSTRAVACRLSPVRALQTTSPATISTISSMGHSTGTFTIARNGHQHHVNQMTTCESRGNLQFPLSQRRHSCKRSNKVKRVTVLRSEPLARHGHSATAAASGRSGARCAPVMATIKCTMHTCLREHCNKTSCRIRCDKVPKEQAIACRG